MLVVSDTHGDRRILEAVIKQGGVPDAVIHAGDHFADSVWIQKNYPCQVYGVAGNCDWGRRGPDELVVDLSGIKILITHGHRLGVKAGLSEIVRRGKQLGVDVCIFGHTHVPLDQKMENLHLFNPGSPCRPRDHQQGSYGWLTVSPDGYHLRHMVINNF